MQASKKTCLVSTSRRWASGDSLGTHTHLIAQTLYLPVPCSQKQTEIQKQRVRYQMEQLCRFLEQQEQLFVAWMEKLAQTIVQVKETYDTQVSRDIALLNELIEELETKQCQPEWELMQVSVAGPGLALPFVPSRMTWAPNTDISSAPARG